MLVVDGEVTDIDLSGLDYKNHNVQLRDYADLINIHPNDIEEIDVWRATPADIEKYGERASGGIVFITTKKACADLFGN